MEATAFEGRIKQAVARLMATRGDANNLHVSVPVLYPSGAASAVDVALNGSECFVSDMGIGHSEALLGNAEGHYNDLARRAAGRFGIGYDGQSIFMLRASLDRIEGAIAAVANASVQAASLAILRAEEEKDRRRNDEVYDRVRAVFGPSSVEKQAEIGGRHASWTAHNVVVLPQGKRAVFEFVANHHNAIASKYLMFSDITLKADRFVTLNAVVRSIEKLGVKGGMLQDVASILEINASNDDFLRYAKVA